MRDDRARLLRIVPGSGSEIGNQLHSELGPGNLYGADLHNTTADEARGRSSVLAIGCGSGSHLAMFERLGCRLRAASMSSAGLPS